MEIDYVNTRAIRAIGEFLAEQAPEFILIECSNLKEDTDILIRIKRRKKEAPANEFSEQLGS